MTAALHLAALLVYLLAAAILIRSFLRGATAAPRAALHVALVAFLLHTAGLWSYAHRFEELPLVGLGASLASLGWLVGGLNAFVLTRRDARAVALVLTPLVALLVLLALLRGIAPEGEAAAFRGVWLSLHVLAAFAGYAALALAFAAALLYLIQFRELRGRRFGRIFSFFPSLDTLDRLGRRALGIGFVALTLGLVLGWAWTLRFQRSMATSNPQVLWGIITWFVFLLAILARRGGAEQERRAALVTVLGFAVVLAAYVALRVSGAAQAGFL